MGEIFSVMRRVNLPEDIGLPEARIMADEQIKIAIPDKVTRSFILMNLYKAVNGAYVCNSVPLFQYANSKKSKFSQFVVHPNW